jgi:hypothetical protein
MTCAVSGIGSPSSFGTTRFKPMSGAGKRADSAVGETQIE